MTTIADATFITPLQPRYAILYGFGGSAGVSTGASFLCRRARKIRSFLNCATIVVLPSNALFPAREGAAAGEAADALLRMSVLPLDDERVDRILQTTPLDVKARICDTLLFDKVPLARLHEHVKACLVSEDEAISIHLEEMLYSRDPPGTNELFKEVLPNVPSKKVRARMRYHLELPDEVEEYWEDENDELHDRGDSDEDYDEDDEDDEFLGDA